MLAHLLEEAQKCPMCGTAPWEWQADNRAYEPVPQVCTGCFHRDSMSKVLEDSPGQTVQLIPRAQARAQRAAHSEVDAFLAGLDAEYEDDDS